jgi:hypothetical protein
MEKDVTEKMKFGFSDDEYLPIEKCICGREFPAWEFFISVYPDLSHQCPSCKRRFYFRPDIRIFQVIGD